MQASLEINLKTDILDPFGAKWAKSLCVAAPGKVSSWDPVTRLIGVDWQSPFRTGVKGQTDEAPGVSVPVWTPGGDGYGLYFDLAKDDPLLGIAADRPQFAFWTEGKAAAPQQGGYHNRAYSMALPGGRYSKDGSVNTAGEFWLGAENESATIKLKRARSAAGSGTVNIEATGATSEVVAEAVTVKVGAAADSPIARATDLISAIDAALSAAIGAAVPNDGGKLALQTFQSTWNGLKAAINATVGQVK